MMVANWVSLYGGTILLVRWEYAYTIFVPDFVLGGEVRLQQAVLLLSSATIDMTHPKGRAEL